MNQSSDRPLVTIITATYNAASCLRRTIESIRRLKYENIEWIVIDGGSKDGTVEIIQENEDIIGYWVSEPDAGIYDAWNKGVRLACGDWIAFLGAGDRYKQDAINNYMNAITASTIKPNLTISKIQFVNSNGRVLRVWGAPLEWKSFKKYMSIAHVGALHHASLFDRHGLFDTSYSSSSDYEFLMRCGKDLKTLFLDVVTADMLFGGVSSGYRCLQETYLVQVRYGAGWLAKYRLWVAYAKRFIRPLLRGY